MNSGIWYYKLPECLIEEKEWGGCVTLTYQAHGLPNETHIKI